ncbi:MAG: ECF RNA polymerase sigma factor SigL [Phycisphaerae bacterium]|nr:ECF RNA polymerase sigma factor SigL [Phycisphaerae bacterium]
MDDGFRKVVDEHASMLLAYLYAIVRDRPLAEDLLQETFLSAYRQRRKAGDRLRNPAAWLRTVARHHAFRAMRRQDPARLAGWEQVDGDGAFEWVGPTDDGGERLLVQLRECRRRLPDQQRRVVEMFYDGRRSADEIARELGLAAKTVYQTLWLARKNLRECIQRQIGRED